MKVAILLSSLCIVVSYLGWVSAQIKALGLVFNVVTDGAISQEMGMVLGTAIVLITHDLGVVRQVTDRIVVLYRGEIVEQGPPATFFANPKTDRLKTFLSQILGH